MEKLRLEFFREKEIIKHSVEESIRGGERAQKLDNERRIAELENKPRAEIKDKQQQILAAQGELEACQEELSSTRKRLREMENRVSQLEEEKNELNQHYSSLIQVHNQMLQFDIQKNEKTLHNERNSFLLTESDISVARITNNNPTYSSSKKLRDLSIGNSSLFSGVYDKKVELKSKDTTLVTIPVRLDYGSAKAAVENYLFKSVREYKLKGSLSSGAFTVPIDDSGKIEIKK